MHDKNKSRLFYSIGFLVALASILAALYFQIFEHLNPCPLCIMQRISYILVIIISFIAILYGPNSKKSHLICCTLLSVSVLFGIFIAIRQLYLENYPTTEAGGCGLGIGYLFQNMPLKDFLYLMFNGSSDCGLVSWQFLGQSMAFWSMMVLLGLLLLYFFNAVRMINKFR
ncbi:disulfide bond formation protein B [Thiotrichales bacterium 19S9-12]|nr:disulfide bond formation protein B [Thiotrichales bacterium 19S9-11]MCF6811823.1 disulfide bond formation protein B [Thiotrichales bacterium 19S9-12]